MNRVPFFDSRGLVDSNLQAVNRRDGKNGGAETDRFYELRKRGPHLGKVAHIFFGNERIFGKEMVLIFGFG